MMNHLELLKKYIKYVMTAEGFGMQPSDQVVFTDEEMAEINRITDEVLND